MEIREIVRSDVDDLIKLYEHLISDDDVLLPDQALTTWNEISENPRIKYFGVYIGGELVSACNIAIIPNLTRGCRPMLSSRM
jgi:hypothetical protein